MAFNAELRLGNLFQSLKFATIFPRPSEVKLPPTDNIYLSAQRCNALARFLLRILAKKTSSGNDSWRICRGNLFSSSFERVN